MNSLGPALWGAGAATRAVAVDEIGLELVRQLLRRGGVGACADELEVLHGSNYDGRAMSDHYPFASRVAGGR